MKAKPASDVLAGGLIEPGIQHQEGTPESVSGTRAHGNVYGPVAFHATQRPIRKLPGGTCWLGIPKIELSVFVPGPWVVDGASPERRFSHAASTALERLPPVRIIRLPW